LSTIDPSAVRAFVAGIDQARGHAASALSTIDQLAAGGAGEADSLLFDAGMHVDFMSGALQDARRLPTTHAAADAARSLAVEGAGDLRTALAGLRDELTRAGGAVDAPTVLARADRVRASLNRVANWELDEVARRATDPFGPEDATLGAVTEAGAWRSFAAAADAELASAGRALDDEHAALSGAIDEIDHAVEDARRAGGTTDGTTFDADIAADDLARELEVGDIVGAIRNAPPQSGTSLFESLAAELRLARPLDDHTAAAPARMIMGQQSGGRAAVTGAERLLDAPLADGVHAATLRYDGAGAGGGITSVELPLVASGRRELAPTRAEAIHLAKLDAESTWLVMPRADAGWELVEVHAAGSNIDDVNQLVRFGGSMSGVRQEHARIDALVTHGAVTNLHASQVGIDETVARAMARFDETRIAKVTRHPAGELDMPRSGTHVLDLDVPAGPLASARTIRVEVTNQWHHLLVQGTRQEALETAAATLGDFRSTSALAVVKLDTDRHALVLLDGDRLSPAAIKRLGGALDRAGLRAPGGIDVEALFVGSRRAGVRGIDLRSGDAL
jgi:hypothetical protein